MAKALSKKLQSVQVREANAEAGRDTTHDDRHEVVEVTVGRDSELKRAEADVVAVRQEVH